MYETQETEQQVDDSAQSTLKPKLYYGWVIVTVCFLVMALIAPVLATFSIFYVAILEDLGWSRADTAFALSAYFLVSGLTSPVAGGLIDRYGPRIVMPIGALVTALAFIWISQMSTRWEFYLAFGVLGSMGATMLNLVPLTAVVSNWFVRHRGLAIGLITGGQGLGQVGIPIIQQLIDNVGWRNTYVVLALVILIVPSAMVLLFLYRRPADKGLSIEDESRSKPAQPGTQATARRREVIVVNREWAETEWTIGKSVRTMRFWVLVVVMVLYSSGFVIINLQFVAYLRDMGYSLTLAAAAVGFEGFVNIIGRFAGGALSDRIGREQTMTLGVGLILICVLLLHASSLVASPLLVYSAAACFGLGNGFALPAFMAATADLFQGKNFGSILGIAILGGYSGGALGAWLSGLFYDITNSYDLNFLVTVAAMVISAILIWKVRPGRIRYVATVRSVGLE